MVINQQSKEIDSLKEEQRESQQLSEENSRLRQELDQVSELKSKLDDVYTQNSNLKKEIVVLSSEKAELLEQLQKSESSWSFKLHVLQDEFDRRWEGQQKELSSLQHSLSDQIEKLSSELKENKRKAVLLLQEKDEEIETLKSSLMAPPSLTGPSSTRSTDLKSTTPRQSSPKPASSDSLESDDTSVRIVKLQILLKESESRLAEEMIENEKHRKHFEEIERSRKRNTVDYEYVLNSFGFDLSQLLEECHHWLLGESI